jgi:hypothetical protein
MKNIILFLSTILFMSGCVNKHGISLKRYSDCDEYYDMQGYYHHECGKDDVFEYKSIGKGIDYILGDEEKQNVWQK